MNENAMKLQELLKDEEKAKEFFAIENPEDAQDYLSDHGIQLSMDEINEIGDTLNKVVSGEISKEELEKAANDELSLDELEDVSGGSVIALSLLAAGMVALYGGLVYTGARSRRW